MLLLLPLGGDTNLETRTSHSSSVDNSPRRVLCYAGTLIVFVFYGRLLLFFWLMIMVLVNTGDGVANLT